MLQSWLKFTGSFSFHFSKLPRQNFPRKFCHPFKEGEFLYVLNFENNRRSLRSRAQHSENNGVIKKIKTSIYKFFSQNFVFCSILSIAHENNSQTQI